MAHDRRRCSPGWRQGQCHHRCRLRLPVRRSRLHRTRAGGGPRRPRRQTRRLAIADTIGVGVPRQVTDIVAGLRALNPDIPLRAHFHNTRNTGYANAVSAVAAGVTVLDASAGGIGGCPFAPGATGNIATEDLLYLLDKSDIPVRSHRADGAAIDPMEVAEIGTWIAAESPAAASSGHARPRRLVPVSVSVDAWRTLNLRVVDIIYSV
ncbi:hypothetical protein [Aeromicrobium sp. UC242_57]|uniref:hypothetical protein n=1 Tax=Aeromicrobium sp. UC242_57 TaxID=3374624 RepID=UPI0037A83E06